MSDSLFRLQGVYLCLREFCRSDVLIVCQGLYLVIREFICVSDGLCPR